MKARKPIAILISLILLSIAVAGANEKTIDDTAPEISNTRTASCMIKLSADQEFLPLEINTVDYLMHSSGVYAKAAHEILDYQLSKDIELFQISSTELIYSTSSNNQAITFELQVNLPEDIKPAAQEFMLALAYDFRKTVQIAFHTNYRAELSNQLALAESQRNQVLAQLTEAMTLTPADTAAKKQLDKIVDISQLTSNNSFSDAIDILKHAVDPPLPIVVLWLDLEENAEIERATPIGIDFVSAIPLGKALELLLKSTSQGPADLAYQIDRGIITIATTDGLPANKQQILLQAARIDDPVEINDDTKRDILRHKHNLEMDIAGMDARRDVIEEQIFLIKREVVIKINEDIVAEELKKLVAIQTEHFENIKKFAQAGRAETTQVKDAEEKLARARIELAKRREEIGKSAGGNRLVGFNGKLTEMTIDLAEKKAFLRVIDERLEKAEEQLYTAAAYDPQISQIRAAREAFQNAEDRLSELKVRIANLQPPTINILGAK